MLETVTQGFSTPTSNTALPYFEETPKFQLLMSLIHRALQWIMGLAARTVCARPGLIVAVGLVLAAGSTFVVVTRFKLNNNTTDLLSDKYPARQHYQEFENDFGTDYRFIVLIQSTDPAQNHLVADEVGHYLETLKPQLTTVLYKVDFSALKQRLLFTCSPDELQKIDDQLESQLNMQKQSQAKSEQMALDLNSILDEANKKFDEKYLREKKNWVEFKPFVAQFVSILNKVTEQAGDKKAPPEEDKAAGDDNALDAFDATEMLAQHEYFSLEDGQSVLVFAYTGVGEKDSSAPFSLTTEKIRAKLLQIESEHPGVKAELTGEPALDADEAAASGVDALKAISITLTLIIALFLLSYRTYLRPTFTFLVLIMGVLWSLGFALIVVGHFNVLSIAVIPMVLGIGIDFGIQILGRYEEELSRGRTIEEAVTAALRHTGVAIITGGGTTAVAFFTLCFNDYVGLAELGVIAGASMVLCITANLLVLPAVFILRDRNLTAQQLQAHSNDSAWHFIRTWDRDMVRYPWLWIGLSAVISVISIFSLPYLKFDYNLLHLQDQSANSVQVLHQVMDASSNDQGAQVSTIYASVVADNLDQARDLAKKLSSLTSVAKVDSLLDLVPEHQDVKMPIIQKIVAAAGALNLKPPTNNAVDIPRARRDIKSLLKQAREALKQAQAFASFQRGRDAVAAFSDMVPALEHADRALNSAPVATIQQRFSASSSGAFSNMQKNMELLRIQKADRGLTLADVPPQLQKLYLAANGKVLLQVYGKHDLWERAPDEEFTNQVLAVAPKATGTPVLNYFATELLRVSYLWAAVWAFVAIVVLIFLHFQSLKFLLLTLTPLVLAVLWRTGAMVWLNIEFNPANIVTLPLIIGIDVAFGVYIIDRYREDGRLSIFSGSTGKAIIMSSLTSLFGFSSLLVSTFRGMFDIGQLMSLGIAIGLVTAIFILPQILVLLKPRANNGSAPGAGADAKW